MLSWRPAYLLLVLVRFYFTLCPSYIHPDEHFQGPEVIAGDVFGWDCSKTWEFTSEKPIRSILPMWLAYGTPMTIVRWNYGSTVNPYIVYFCLRIFFFVVSFALEDWALQELGGTAKIRAHYLLMVASSYVTWTFQTHTFSNSIETVVVAWSLVLIRRISLKNFGHERHLWSCSLLGALVTLGVFNRITFPAYLALPAFYLIPQIMKFPSSAVCIVASALITSCVAIYVDTSYYKTSSIVVTPLNNLLYNFQPSNLAKHGIHARYTHILINLPQLLGPYLLFIRPQISITFLSAVSATVLLSIFQHQEARFLAAAVPCFLTAVEFPQAILAVPSRRKCLIAGLCAFNLILAILFGIYHQGGVIPVQSHYINPHLETTRDVIWWKTYSPPDWLLGRRTDLQGGQEFIYRGGLRSPDQISTLLSEAYKSPNIAAISAVNDQIGGARVWDLMGSETEYVSVLLSKLVDIRVDKEKQILLVAPTATKSLYKLHENSKFKLHLEYKYSQHLNLDDLAPDFDLAARQHLVLGFWESKLLFFSQNKPGLGVWSVTRRE
ncbi:Alg9-like mannosyltransferase family-domain-containing protein [Lipomyces oligophaga]|uniref:Alg9-like mannosyltransferase family-domain-containing protein n=1 Tax=Lipomyces oligophaga TaxID=45792 RepID=UPI0034CFD9A1